MARRKPFDPSRIRVPAAERASSTPQTPLTVLQVNEFVRGVIAQHVPATLHVLGELSNVSRPRSGHLYFTLKDADAELRGVMWRSTASKLKFNPDDGLEVIATGELEVYPPRGSYQLIVRKLEPRGVGALEVAFRQLKEKLEAEGLFDPRHKQPLPRIPQRVAVVTSATGAAIRDITQTLARRMPAIDILVFSVRVQGEGAATEIARAVREMNRRAAALGGIDVAIVGRGGGSLEDLWAFNEEVVARAIAASRIPIVSAVGHEVDVSIADLVADVRAATPTAAAELVAPSRGELADWLRARMRQATDALQSQLRLARADLRTVRATEPLARPLRRVQEQTQRVDELTMRLQHALDGRLRREHQRLDRAAMALVRFGTGVQFARLSVRLQQRAAAVDAALLDVRRRAERRFEQQTDRLSRHAPQTRLPALRRELLNLGRTADAAARRLVAEHERWLRTRAEAVVACDPRSILGRGYSITRDAKTGQVIRSIEAIRDKQRIVTEVADGEFRATADDPKQPDLFD